jgi:hypothetical protein
MDCPATLAADRFPPIATIQDVIDVVGRGCFKTRFSMFFLGTTLSHRRN